jgi:hypothetical protein
MRMSKLVLMTLMTLGTPMAYGFEAENMLGGNAANMVWSCNTENGRFEGMGLTKEEALKDLELDCQAKLELKKCDGAGETRAACAPSSI